MDCGFGEERAKDFAVVELHLYFFSRIFAGFHLSEFVEFVSFIQCASSSRVMFHITLASHMELGTKLNIKLFGHRMCL